MKDFSRCLGVSVVTYAALVVFTSLWKLFQLGGSSASVKTLLGITIDNKITEHKISTTFDLSWQTLIGILIPLNYYTLVLKVTCLMNLFNLLPFTADGEVILLSIVQLIQKEKNSEK